MARKVLISFLGTGSLNQNDKSSRQYRTAKYEDKEREFKDESSFFAATLSKYLEIDAYIFVGTMKSMWEEAYRFFKEKNEPKLQENEDWVLDDAVYERLTSITEKANYETPLDSNCFNDFEVVLGNGSKVVPVKYGINKKEIEENIAKIVAIEELLQDGDEVYIDITHSFRSLSMIMMTAIMYLQDVSEKAVKVKGIYYGMLDVARDLGYAPIVSLDALSDTIAWIKGAHSFTNFGNGYLIAKMLKGEKLKKQIQDFSDILNLNYINEVPKHLPALRNTERGLQNESTLARMLIPKITNKFLGYFEKPEHKEGSGFQVQLAQWHSNNSNYAAAYITLAEAIVTFACEKKGYDPQECKRKDIREEEKDRIKECYPEFFADVFKPVNQIRNRVAHNLEKTERFKQDIENLKTKFIPQTKIFFQENN